MLRTFSFAKSSCCQYVLDPDLKIESPYPSEVAPDKKKMNPRDQRKYAASKPRHSFKNLPEGWTREKVARAYETAPLRGIPKSTWLEKWAEKYDFPLCRSVDNAKRYPSLKRYPP